MNSGNSKSSNPHKLLVNLVDKIALERDEKFVSLSNLCIYDTWKNI